MAAEVTAGLDGWSVVMPNHGDIPIRRLLETQDKNGRRYVMQLDSVGGWRDTDFRLIPANECPVFWRPFLDEKTSKPDAWGIQEGGDHYKDMPIQPALYCHQNGLTWYEANVVKYVSRHKFKEKAGDIKKAIHYLQLLMEDDYNTHVEVKYTEKEPGPQKGESQ